MPKMKWYELNQRQLGQYGEYYAKMEFASYGYVVYIIPAIAWQEPNAVLVDRNYDKPGQKSKPEWGISYSNKNKGLIERYKAENYFKRFSLIAIHEF